MSNSLHHHGLQHARLPCPWLTPGVCSNSCPLSQWCHPTISSSVIHFSSCPQSFPASWSFLIVPIHSPIFGGQWDEKESKWDDAARKVRRKISPQWYPRIPEKEVSEKSSPHYQMMLITYLTWWADARMQMWLRTLSTFSSDSFCVLDGMESESSAESKDEGGVRLPL